MDVSTEQQTLSCSPFQEKNQIRPCYVFIQCFFQIVCLVKGVSPVISHQWCFVSIIQGGCYLKFHVFSYLKNTYTAPHYKGIRTLLWVRMFPCQPVWCPPTVDYCIFTSWIFRTFTDFLLWEKKTRRHISLVRSAPWNLSTSVICFICN